jgi:hypothetical protein
MTEIPVNKKICIFTNCKYCGKAISKRSTQCRSCYFKHKKAPWLKKYQFKKGCIPWHKGKKTGLIPKTAFKKGHLLGLKSGRVKHSFGYIWIYSPNHPYRDSRKYILEHRLVMEKHLGRYLKPEEVVHHINGIKDDNRIENLMLYSNNGEHLSFELTGMKYGTA